ncbi:exo-beta-N-acetylmuramidase NamZ domain-containing protein [Saccharothrix lopnurensis]|uniref:Exo-beta-N-acetylmuramidase NamZ domain-containing protein n=1 Tax=Saccharothrix lopnurensis TaxID=1670621 RepID=A0ABW1NXK2_9PSEU
MDRRHFLVAGAGALAVPALSAPAPAGAEDHRGPSRPRRVETGAEQLAARGWDRFAGRRVGVVTNPTGVLRDHTHVVDSMVAAGRPPAAAFGPEHGFRGTAQAGGSEGDYRDPRTGIPVYDAYGANATKLAGMFTKAGVDTVVFDIADVGARFYTYIWSMYTAMQAAAAIGAEFVVLDRPNPVGGTSRGPQLDPAHATGVGRKPVVQQHGLTVGELALLFNAEFLPDDGGRVERLDVVEVRGWRRDDLDTGLPWVPPSPNVPTRDTALVYPGTCLFEGLVFSEGRGTTRPFETIGAPGLDWRWAEDLNALGLPGVRFREAYFTPTFHKFANQLCGGVALHLTDPSRFDAPRTAVAMIVAAKARYPDRFGWRPDNWIDKLSGSDRLRRMVDAGAGTDEVVGAWQDELAAFERTRRPHLRYR